MLTLPLDGLSSNLRRSVRGEVAKPARQQKYFSGRRLFNGATQGSRMSNFLQHIGKDFFHSVRGQQMKPHDSHKPCFHDIYYCPTSRSRYVVVSDPLSRLADRIPARKR